MAFNSNEYTHNELDKEVRFISGHYLMTEEVRMEFRGRELFYLTGYAVLDTACCGSTGCGYAVVQGVVRKWKYKKNREGYYLSEITPINDLKEREEIQKRLLTKETLQQVVFV